MNYRVAPLASLFAIGLAACATSSKSGAGEPKDPSTTTDAPAAATPTDPKTARITIVGISDFHGWLLPLEPPKFNKYFGGIAFLGGLLTHTEKLDPKTSLVLDNGDMWTGPTVSTFLRGEPVIAAYNELGVAAANIANHEFDFGLEILKARIGEAKFPFLGANIRLSGSDKRPEYVKPWVILERDGVKVGIIGLSYADTPKTTLAVHVQGLEFLAYDTVLKTSVEEVRKEGAEVVVVLFHDTVDVIEKVLQNNKGLGIQAIVAGQNHRKGKRMVEQTPIINPGPFGRSYVKFVVEVDRASRKVTKVTDEIVDVTGEVGAPPAPPAPKLAAIAEGARQRAKSLSGEVLGRLARPLPVGAFSNSPLGHLVTDSWLSAFPDVDVAMCNFGALRQPLGKGPVTIGDLTSVLPFENNLYIVKVNGKQLKTQLGIGEPVVGGVTYKYKETKDGRQIVSAVDRAGNTIGDKKTYTVLINDFMYFGGDNFGFKDYDATPEDTGLSWREPVIRALRLAEEAGTEIAPPPGARAARAK